MSNVYSSQLVRFLRSADPGPNYSADYSFEDAFELYHQIQEGPAADGVGLPALGHALAGSAGTAISNLVLYPLALCVTRLQVQRQLRGPSEAPSAASEADVEYKNLQDAVQKIYKNEGGIKALYAGCITDTSKSIVDAFLFFLAYTFLRKRRQLSAGAHALSVLEELGIGIGAGAFSKLITTPISQIVTRKQTAAMVAARDPTATVPAEHSAKLSVKDIALQIRSERGIRGFWAGYSASLVLTMNPALTFLLHNLLKRYALPRSRRENPGPRLVFLIAAVSKALASTITYPFSLAKTRAQIASKSPSASSSTDKQGAAPRDGFRTPPQTISRPPPGTPPLRTVSNYARQILRLVYSLRPTQIAVLRNVQAIYRAEGLSALYAGLEGEVAKGFLGHGLTMLLKERIHVLVISAHYLVLKATQRWPQDLGDIRDQAGKEFSRVRAAAGGAALGAGERIQNVGETVYEGAKSMVAGEGVK